MGDLMTDQLLIVGVRGSFHLLMPCLGCCYLTGYAMLPLHRVSG